MARMRYTKPEYLTSETIVTLPALARAMFNWMWIHCDDAGVHPASVVTLKVECFPVDPYTIEEVRGWVEILLDRKLLVEFESGGKRYWHVRSWWEHQRVSKQFYSYPTPPGYIEVKNENGRILKLPQNAEVPAYMGKIVWRSDIGPVSVQYQSRTSAGQVQDQSETSSGQVPVIENENENNTPPTPSPGSEGGEAKKPKPIGPEFRPAIEAVEAAGVMFAEDAVQTAAENGHTPSSVIAICHVYAAHAHEIGGPGMLHSRLTKVSARPGPTENWPKTLTKPRAPAALPEDVLRAQFWEQGRAASVPDDEIERRWQQRLSKRRDGPKAA